MNKDMDNYYKTCDFIYLDNKDRIKNLIDNDYGYNIDTHIRKKEYLDDYINKTKTFINKDYLNNHK